jgi:hypothetical protein
MLPIFVKTNLGFANLALVKAIRPASDDRTMLVHNDNSTEYVDAPIEVISAKLEPLDLSQKSEIEEIQNEESQDEKLEA